jgi:hypothetical protein
VKCLLDSVLHEPRTGLKTSNCVWVWNNIFSQIAISSFMQTSVCLSMKEGSHILADDMKSLNFSRR